MAEQGFVLGVDLGTSNTVAVLRWPDGRTRALLFDGLPILPSGTYLDEAGRLHVGRDAQRLAEADPAAYEPNPKRRVDEATVLLRDREVPTVDLLAAGLDAVARAAVEAVGFLPPAVVTYPAGWGARRREVLAAAAARAGWPPPLLVPEPVAAARYFVDVLRRPVPAGASVAVFDFGGGTLDIAVVRNEGAGPDGRARFAVLGSGGVAELGGLDLDAALVEHLGEVLQRTHPQVWTRLRHPTSPADQRARRRFWDDVRGAKEMLSRTASAPIAVPGIDQALHLTREELEQRVTPLLRQGVHEAAAIISRCGLTPNQLVGLFLVGGSSRVPLMARLLHADLGVAPTVLEQPELPVAEGAIAELTPAAVPIPAQRSTVDAPRPVGVATAVAPSSPPSAPVSPVSPAPIPLGYAPPPGAPRPWILRPPAWIAAGAAVAVLAIAGITWFLLNRGPSEVDFLPEVQPAGTIGTGLDSLPFGGTFTQVLGDRAYVAWETESGDNYGLTVIAWNLASNKQEWRKDLPAAEDWAGINALPDGLVVRATGISSDVPRPLYVLDAATGDPRWQRSLYRADYLVFQADTIVLADEKGRQVLGFDVRTGTQLFDVDYPKDQFGGDTSKLIGVTSGNEDSGPATVEGFPVDVDPEERRVVLIGYDKSALVIDVHTGQTKRIENVGSYSDEYLAHSGRLYAKPYSGNRDTISSFDLANPGQAPAQFYTSADRDVVAFRPCGKDRVCVIDQKSSDAETTETALYDAAGKQLWRKPTAGAKTAISLGESVLVSTGGSSAKSWVVDGDGTQSLRPGQGIRVNPASALFFDDDTVFSLGVDSGAYDSMDTLTDARLDTCSWNDQLIVCGAEKDFQIWRFANG